MKRWLLILCSMVAFSLGGYYVGKNRTPAESAGNVSPSSKMTVLTMKGPLDSLAAPAAEASPTVYPSPQTSVERENSVPEFPETLFIRESANGEVFWVRDAKHEWVGHTKDEFKFRHGIEPENVAIPRPPKTEDHLRDFLTGTIWSWGSSPEGDREWVIFLDDDTIYGSWGYRYQYTIDPETLEVVWAEHRTRFSEGFRYLQTGGRYDRIGMLLKRTPPEEMEEFLGRAEGMHLISEDEPSVPDRR